MRGDLVLEVALLLHKQYGGRVCARIDSARQRRAGAHFVSTKSGARQPGRTGNDIEPVPTRHDWTELTAVDPPAITVQ